MNANEIAERIVQSHAIDPTLIVLIIRVIFYLHEMWKDCNFKPLKDRECKIQTRFIARRILGRIKYREYGDLIINELVALKGQYSDDKLRTMQFPSGCC